MTEPLDELYRDIIMDHYRYPRGRKEVADADVVNSGQNPVCGDQIKISIKVSEGKVEDIGVDCMGCAISVASGSMLAETIKGKKLDEVKKIARTIKAILKGEPTVEDIEIGEWEALSGVKNFPVRVKCALLSWTTLVDGIEALEKNETAKISTTE